MALKQSAWAQGALQAPTSREGGGVVVEKYKYITEGNLASGDIIELGILPAFHSIVGAVLITDAMGAGVTADVGIMSGEVGSTDPARTCGSEIYAAADVAAAGATRNTKVDGFRLAPVEAHRSVGVKLGAAVTGAGKVVELILFTKQ